MKKNKKIDQEGFTKLCKKCEYRPNCAGWADKTICRSYMGKYFGQHPKERIWPTTE